MGIPVGATKFVIGGTLNGGETFQTAWWEQWPLGTEQNDASIVLMAASGPFTTLLAAAKVLLNPASSFTTLDAYGYAGGTAAASHGHATYSIAGTGLQTHPNQIALVTTLRTATTGRSGRGRMYWPANGCNYSSASGLNNTAQVDGLVDAIATFFGSRVALSANPIVVSQTHTTAAHITSVDADYVLDTQRRRNARVRSVRHSHAV